MDKKIEFGLVKDPTDGRDLLWRSVVAPQLVSVPTKHLISATGAVLNQEDKPHCVGYSTASLKMQQEFKEHKKYYAFDPDWMYNECKKQDGYLGDGTYLRVALKIIQQQGYLAKAERYKLKDDTFFKIERYIRLTSKQQIKEALYHIGPVVFGITVDENIFSPVRGIVPEPGGKVIGGHAMLIVGYDDNKKCLGSRGAFRIKNSWGKEWGSKGLAWLPYSHFDTYSDWDAWRSVDVKDLLEEI